MKRAWLVLLFTCGCLSLRAQTIMVSDLLNIMNLQEDEAKSYLYAKGFKLKIISQQNGFTVNQFELTLQGKLETVVYGQNTKALDGTVLHTIRYSTNTGPYMVNLIAGAQRSGLQLDFKGADSSKDIYFYNSVLYRASIYFNFNHDFGLVEIRQKDLGGG